MPEIIVGRQPIFDRYQQVIGYELLYRSAEAGPSRPDGDGATMQVILSTFSNLGLERLVGRLPAFINLTRNFLVGRIPIPFPPQQVVLEVLEDVEIDDELLQALSSLRDQGYQIALDDVIALEPIQPLLPLAHLVKIDLPRVDRGQWAALVTQLRSYAVKLVAEKVETPADWETCYQLGFDLFQGYFLCRPSLVRGRRLDSSRLVLLRLLAQVQNPAVDFRRLSRLVAQDVGLSYKLLKLANSAYYGRPTPITTLEQAITLIGLNHLRGWLTLLQMAALDNKPPELMRIALVRARMCERLARALQLGAPDPFFLTGLLSVLDALLDLPMAEATAALPLAQPVIDGLQERRGPTGQALNLVNALERGEWEALARLPIDAQTLTEIFIDALAWADNLIQSTRETTSA